jgi:hypothetical protein
MSDTIATLPSLDYADYFVAPDMTQTTSNPL